MGETRLVQSDRWDWLRLQLGKSNAVGPEFLDKLDAAIDGLSVVEDGPVRPLIVTGEGSAFSGGLDLRTLIDYDRARLAAFVRRFHGVFLRLACLQRPTIAAVNGHAVAGGAVLAVACDVRIGVRTIGGTDKVPVLGFNEVTVGLPFPRSAAAILEHGLGGPERAADLMLTGRLVEPPEALQRGLLHSVVEAKELTNAAEQAAEHFVRGAASAVAAVKADLKARLVTLAAEPVDDSPFLDAWFSAGTQARLRQVVARLAGG